MQAGEIGRWTAASTASSSLEAFCAKAAAKAAYRQIDQPVCVRRELRRLRMRLAAREHVRDCLAFVRCERGDIDERLHFVAARRRDDRAGVSVADENDRRGDALERPVERRDIVGERCQRQRRRDRFDPARCERRNHFRPARSVSPGAMDEHDAHVIHRHLVPPEIARGPIASNLLEQV